MGGCPALVLLFAALAGASGAQTPPRDTRPPGIAPPTGTASISGTVVVAGTGQPARRARVSLSSPEPRVSLTRTSDAQGRFAFTNLPEGRYTLSASKPGHVNATYGQHRPGRPGTSIQLANGQTFQAQLLLPRGGAITGAVLDEHGEATPGISVRALRWTMASGQRTLQPTGNGTTDDRGIYRIYGLQPGDYVVCATPRGSIGPDMERVQVELEALQRQAESAGDREPAVARALADRIVALNMQVSDTDQPAGFAPVCYPGTANASGAGAVALGVSEERGGVDFQLQVVNLARIDGTVMNPMGSPLQNQQLTLAPAGDMPSSEVRSARVQPDGRFNFAAVPPGQYTLIARATVGPPSGRGAPPAPSGARTAAEQVRLWSALDLSVDGRNLSNVIVTLQSGLTVSGQIAFDGATTPPADLTRARVSLNPAGGDGFARTIASSSSGRVDAAGRFTIPNVVPGRYRLSGSSGGDGWVVESAVIAGQDTADFPIDIRPGQTVTGATLTFTDRQTEFAGTIVNERNEPVSTYTVIVFAADPRYWTGLSRRIQTSRPGTDGRFTLRNLPPGDYKLATVVDPEPGSWYDPAYLQQIDAVSTRLTIGPGEKKVQHVRVSTQQP